MRRIARSALAGTAATLLALATGASAHADVSDRTVWPGADSRRARHRPRENLWHARSPDH
ncbi:hypothetical protein [Streptomyces sp. NPDC002788]